MTNWISFDDSELSKTTNTSSGGSRTVVSESPFNIPEALRLEIQSNPNRVVLEFRYLGDATEIDEPLKQCRLSPQFAVFDGKNSRRIYKIEISSDLNFDDSLVSTIEQVIRDFDRQNTRPRTLGRYQVLIEAWKKTGTNLFDNLKTQLKGRPGAPADFRRLSQSAG